MTNAQDPMERRLEALAYREAEEEGDRGRCPGDETFGAFMDGRLEGLEKEEILDHLEACPACRLALEAWREAERAAVQVPGPLVEEAKGLVRRPLRRVVLKLLARAVELLDPGESESFGTRPETAAVPCRGEAARAAEQEVLELSTGFPEAPCVRVQHLTVREEVRLTFLTDPALSPEETRSLRLDLHGPRGLVQSWPLDPAATVMNPVERGVYRVEIYKIKSCGDSPRSETLGTLLLELV